MAISRPKAPRKLKAQKSPDTEENLPPVIELTAQEAWDEYVRRAKHDLGVTPDEFERRWARGDYEDPPLHSDAVGVWMIRVSKPGS